jgi:hypothetical protein
MNEAQSLSLSVKFIAGSCEFEGVLASTQTDAHSSKSNNGNKRKDSEGKHNFDKSVTAFGFVD